MMVVSRIGRVYCIVMIKVRSRHTSLQKTRLRTECNCVHLIISIIQTLQSSIAKRLECMTRTLSIVNSASDS